MNWYVITERICTFLYVYLYVERTSSLKGVTAISSYYLFAFLLIQAEVNYS